MAALIKVRGSGRTLICILLIQVSLVVDPLVCFLFGPLTAHELNAV